MLNFRVARLTSALAVVGIDLANRHGMSAVTGCKWLPCSESASEKLGGQALRRRGGGGREKNLPQRKCDQSRALYFDRRGWAIPFGPARYPCHVGSRPLGRGDRPAPGKGPKTEKIEVRRPTRLFDKAEQFFGGVQVQYLFTQEPKAATRDYRIRTRRERPGALGCRPAAKRRVDPATPSCRSARPSKRIPRPS